MSNGVELEAQALVASLPPAEAQVDEFNNAEEKKLADEKLSASAAVTVVEQFEYPDGGLQAWLQVLGCLFVYIASWGVVGSWGVFQTYLGTTRLPNESASNIGWIGSLQITIFCAVGPPVGRLFDQGHCRKLLVCGTLLYALCTFTLQLCDQLWQIILCLGLGLGLAMGCVYYPAIACVGHYFKRRRGLALGLAAAGSSLTYIEMPLQLSHMFASDGWATATNTWAAINVSLLVIASLLLKPRLPPKPTGQLFSLKPFQDLSFSLFAIGAGLAELSIWIPVFYAADRALTAGASAQTAFNMIIWLGVGSLFGRVLPTWLSDTVGIFTSLTIDLAVLSLLAFCWIACTSTSSLIAFNILYGFFSGAYVAGMPAGAAPLTPDMRELGLRSGMLFLACAVPALGGAPAGGALFATASGPVAVGVFSGGILVVATACLGAVWWRQRRARGTWRV